MGLLTFFKPFKNFFLNKSRKGIYFIWVRLTNKKDRIKSTS